MNIRSQNLMRNTVAQVAVKTEMDITEKKRNYTRDFLNRYWK
jgi:hypothetical protein